MLRPGRLDRLIYCDFPGTDDRLEILTALSRRSKLDNDVDLRAVAEATEGFTGADLSALLSEAQLLAVHEMLDAAAAEVRAGCRSVLLAMDEMFALASARCGQAVVLFVHSAAAGCVHMLELQPWR